MKSAILYALSKHPADDERYVKIPGIPVWVRGTLFDGGVGEALDNATPEASESVLNSVPCAADPYPALPSVPDGYIGWTPPALVPSTIRPMLSAPMAFFHDNGDDEDIDQWWETDAGDPGTFGGPTTYPVFYIVAYR